MAEERKLSSSSQALCWWKRCEVEKGAGFRAWSLCSVSFYISSGFPGSPSRGGSPSSGPSGQEKVVPGSGCPEHQGSGPLPLETPTVYTGAWFS